MNVLLLLSLAIPGAAAGLLMAFRNSMVGRMSRWIALVAALATLMVSLGMVSEFSALPAPSDAAASANDATGSPVQPRFEVRYHWFELPATGAAGAGSQGFRMEFRFGLDGISLALVVLTTVLTVSCVL